ncbi:MAG: histidine--tRNA ligase [Candidatus Njordarchaeales archaeon]
MPYQIPSGFRDFPPEIMILRKKVVEIIEDNFQKYGFDPIETPALEYWDTLKGKYGEEAERMLVYKFKDPWSEQWYALRYDLTVPLARFFSMHSYPLPFKRYHIGRVWRHDRPQRGRYREIWQADADIVGSPFPEADAEVIDLTIEIFHKLGFRNFCLKLNDRRVLSDLFERELNFSQQECIRIYRIIDKLDKIGLEGVKEELTKAGLSKKEIERILEIIDVQGGLDEVIERLQVMKSIDYSKIREKMTHIMEILDLLGSKKSFVKIDFSLVRGLDYYTGPIWEVVIEDAGIGSVAGGGRYDELIKLYSGHDYPATGTSIGIDRVIDAGLLTGVFETKKKTYTQIYVVVLSRDLYQRAWHLVSYLRENGFRVQIDLMRRSQQKQREYALKKGVPVLIFLGSKEVEKNVVTIYDRESNTRKEVSMKNVITYLKEILSE